MTWSGPWSFVPITCLILTAARKSDCLCRGKSGLQPTAGGGTPLPFAALDRFPYMVSVQTYFTKTHICGGVLVSPFVVLTAAHCIDPNIPSAEQAPRVTIGGNTVTDDANSERTEACRTVIHQKWTGNVSDGFDIGLIFLKERSSKLFLKLDRGGSIGDGTVLAALGWRDNRSGQLARSLKVIDLEYVDNERCRNAPGLWGIESNMMCALRRTEDTCKGDSGGPLVFFNDIDDCSGEDILVGLTSFGHECGKDANVPGVYTRISNFVDWIDRRGEGESIEAYVGPNCGAKHDSHTPRVVTPTLALKEEPFVYGECFAVNGVDYSGIASMNNGRVDVLETPEECCDLCRRTPGCRAWTFMQLDLRLSYRGSCWLREFVPAPRRCAVCTSGIVTQGLQARKRRLNSDACLVRSGCDHLLGMALDGTELSVSKRAFSFAECCSACNIDPMCVGFNWFVTQRRCVLLGDLGLPAINSTSKAGIVRNRVKEDEMGSLMEIILGEEKQIQSLRLMTLTGACQMMVGVDLKASSKLLTNGKNMTTDTAEACSKKCQEWNTQTGGEKCRSWTWIQIPTRHNPRGACWLKSDVASEVPCAACISGVIAGQGILSLASGEASETCSLLSGISLRGPNLNAMNATITSNPLECCWLCERLPKCKAWTRMSDNGRCLLKGGAVPNLELERCDNCNSGIQIKRVTSDEIAHLFPVVAKP